MSHAGARGTAQRVVVAMGDAAAGREAVDAAVRLACALDAQLTALFLENADLARAAELPFLHETCALSGTVRPMAGPAMLRTLRTRAEQVVAAAAEASGVSWRFEVVRGSGVALACAGRDALDVLVLAQAPRHGLAHAYASALSRPALDARPVAVTVRDTPGAVRVLRAAQAVASACGAPLLLLLAGDDVDDDRRLRQLTAQALGAVPKGTRYLALRNWNVDAIAAAARQHKARLLVCCDGELRRDAARLESLLARLRCPLVVAD